MFLSKHKCREKEAAWTARLLFPAELSRYFWMVLGCTCDGKRLSWWQSQRKLAAKKIGDYEAHSLCQAQGELDDLIASECVFCGDLMIRSLVEEKRTFESINDVMASNLLTLRNIDKPFIDDQEFDRVIAEWLWRKSYWSTNHLYCIIVHFEDTAS